MATSTEKRVVSLTLDAKQFAAQIKGLRDQLTGVRTAAEGTNKSLQNISSTLGLVSKATAAAYAITRITDFVGAIQDANNVLRSVTDSTEEFTKVQGRLFDIANNTGAAIGQTTQAYARVARALQGTGRSSEDVLRITERLNKALLVSGASAGEAASTLTQFSQALQSGKLQGDEFRSLTENAPLVINAIAQVSGQGRAALKELAKEGKLTADVLVEALAGEAGAAIDKAAEGYSKTIPQAINIFKNKVIELITTNQSAVSGLSLIAEAIIVVANNLVAASTAFALFAARARIATALTALSTAMATYAASTGTAGLATRSLVAALGLTLPASAAATTGIGGTTVALAALRTAIASTGVGVLVIALGLLAQTTIDAAQTTSTFSDFLKRMGEQAADGGRSLLSMTLEMQKSMFEALNFFGVLDKVIANIDSFTQGLEDNTDVTEKNAAATARAAAEKEVFAKATADASAAVRQLNVDMLESIKTDRIKTNQLLDQAAAFKKGGQAALDRIKIEQQVQDKFLETQEKYETAGVGPTGSDAIASAAAQTLRRQLEAEASLQNVTAKPARARKEPREKEYQTLNQILEDVKLKAADAAGALAAFEAGGETALTAFNNAAERRNVIAQKTEEFEKNKLKLTPAQLELEKQKLDLLLKEAQTSELVLDVKQRQAEQQALINIAERDSDDLIAARNVLLNEGLLAYEAVISAQDSLRQAESAIKPIIGETNAEYEKRLAALLALIEANKKVAKETQTAQAKMAESTKQYADLFSKMIDSVVSGSVKFKDAIKAMLKELLILILQQIIFNALAGSSNSFIAGIGTAGGGTKSAPVGGKSATFGGTKSAAMTTATAVAQNAAYGGGKSSRSSGPMQIVVNNSVPGVEVQARTRSDGEIVELAVQRVTGMIRRGGNGLATALESTYAMGRGQGAQ